MKKEVSPAIVGIVIAVIVLIAGGLFFLNSRSNDGDRPPAGAATGPSIGGKHLPSAAGAGAGTAPAAGTAAPNTAQGAE